MSYYPDVVRGIFELCGSCPPTDLTIAAFRRRNAGEFSHEFVHEFVRFAVTDHVSKCLDLVHSPFLLVLVESLEVHCDLNTPCRRFRVDHVERDISSVSDRDRDQARAHCERIAITKLEQ